MYYVYNVAVCDAICTPGTKEKKKEGSNLKEGKREWKRGRGKKGEEEKEERKRMRKGKKEQCAYSYLCAR